MSRASPGEDRRVGESVESFVELDLGGGAGGLVLLRISMTTFVVGSDASKELKKIK
jgi:hypothetical protein